MHKGRLISKNQERKQGTATKVQNKEQTEGRTISRSTRQPKHQQEGSRKKTRKQKQEARLVDKFKDDGGGTGDEQTNLERSRGMEEGKRKIMKGSRGKVNTHRPRRRGEREPEEEE